MREIAKISLDLFVLGACSIDAERGIGAFDFEDAQMKAALIEGAGSTVLAVQSKKMGTVATHRVAAINVIADIVVEADASPSLTEPLLSKGIRVHYAKQAQSEMADNDPRGSGANSEMPSDRVVFVIED